MSEAQRDAERSPAGPSAPVRCGSVPVLNGTLPQPGRVVPRQPATGESSVAEPNFRVTA
jgi:hypothetical protein